MIFLLPISVQFSKIHQIMTSVQ